MNRTEALMNQVRESEKGTYAAGRAWVDYMRYAKVPGTEDRREFADMMRRHLKWPLSMRVAVKTPQGYMIGKISGHLREHPHKCSVDFSPNMVDFDGYGLRFCATLPFRNLKKIEAR